jgi:hypothetical protein
MGTAEDAATANDRGTDSRSEQISANCSGVNSKGTPVVRSGGRDQKTRPGTALAQVAEGRAAGHSVEPISKNLGAAPPRRSEAVRRNRRQGLADQPRLETHQQEVVFEAGEDLIPEGRIVGREDAAAGCFAECFTGSFLRWRSVHLGVDVEDRAGLHR